jgi:hypothetical protein
MLRSLDLLYNHRRSFLGSIGTALHQLLSAGRAHTGIDPPADMCDDHLAKDCQQDGKGGKHMSSSTTDHAASGKDESQEELATEPGYPSGYRDLLAEAESGVFSLFEDELCDAEVQASAPETITSTTQTCTTSANTEVIRNPDGDNLQYICGTACRRASVALVVFQHKWSVLSCAMDTLAQDMLSSSTDEEEWTCAEFGIAEQLL